MTTWLLDGALALGKWVAHRIIEGGRKLLRLCLRRSIRRLKRKLARESKKLRGRPIGADIRAAARMGKLAGRLTKRVDLLRKLDSDGKRSVAGLLHAAKEIVSKAIPHVVDGAVGPWESKQGKEAA